MSSKRLPLAAVQRTQSLIDFINEYLLSSSQKWTDYWVSQGRKFCDFCKCSIADNKPSIQFHENGKKHKENVAKRLTEMQKKAAKEAKDAVDLDKEMKRMEAAALRAYMDDVRSNADFTSQLIQSGAQTLPTPEYVEPEPKAKAKPKQLAKRAEKVPQVEKKWMEAKTEDGQSYFWNIDTGESVWEKPEAGYLSISEQQSVKIIKSHKPPKGLNKFKKHKKPGKSSNVFKKLKEKGIEGSKSEENPPKPEEFPVFPSAHPYGKWKKVEPPKEEVVDLQLPKQEYIEIVVPKIKEEAKSVFKEKTVSVFAEPSQGETGFKKRKFTSEAKKNMRRRIDDD